MSDEQAKLFAGLALQQTLTLRLIGQLTTILIERGHLSANEFRGLIGSSVSQIEKLPIELQAPRAGLLGEFPEESRGQEPPA